ncbi:recombinase family protein [Alteromonas sp. ASW11-19]|uniref:Recombinase family protein n=1 Tax=Alteromonas salexigens TaxID=2982530 RepID=A0ABT2VM71_9ALTE|nr:recombinase family protein [Alteromonas salexigens]MCU7554418.1 recombinase family protein [Alteromonas salexigens]
MTDIAYIRVSTTEQNTERQLDGVKVNKTFTDKCSGGSTARPALTDLLDYVREGDTVHVHSIDRLARNLQDLLSLVEEFKSKGVTLKFHKESLTFEGAVTNAMQDLMLSMIGAVAQFEKAMINERQREGIEKAKARGVYSQERAKRVDREEVKALLADGLPMAQIAKKLGCSSKTIQRIKNES